MRLYQIFWHLLHQVLSCLARVLHLLIDEEAYRSAVRKFSVLFNGHWWRNYKMKCQQQERKSVGLYSLVQVGIFKRPNDDSKLIYSAAWAALPKRRVKGSTRDMNQNIDKAYAFIRNSPFYSLRRAPTISITRASVSFLTSSAYNSTPTTSDTSPDVFFLKNPSPSPLP